MFAGVSADGGISDETPPAPSSIRLGCPVGNLRSSDFRNRITSARAKLAAIGAASSQVPALVRALRPAYPYSVIPGGIYSRAELAAQSASDQLVRKHYSDFRGIRSHRRFAGRSDGLCFVSQE